MNPFSRGQGASMLLKAAGQGIQQLTDDDEPTLTAQQRGAKKYRQKQKNILNAIAQTAPYVLGGAIAARFLPRLMQAGAAAGLGGLAQQLPERQAEQPTVDTSETMEEVEGTAPQPDKKKPSLVQQALKGIDIANLEDFQSNRLKPLVKKLESLEGQGKGPNDKTVADLIGRIKKIGGMGVAEQEKARFENVYGDQDQDDQIARQQQERLEPTQIRKPLEDTPALEDGDLVRTKDNRTGRVTMVDPERGIAKVKIDRKVHTKKIDSLTQIEPSELGSSFIDTKSLTYSPDLKLGVAKFLDGPYYAYQNVSEEDWKKFIKGKGTVQTSGVGPTGIPYWVNKNPSAGRAFWNFIRNNTDIPYARVGDSLNLEEFFENFADISKNLEWKIPKPPKKKKRKKR